MARLDNKFVVVVKENLDKGKAMNALAHAMLGFGAGLVTKEEVYLNDYADAEGNVHISISEMPIVILKASSNKIRNLRKLALEHEMKFTDFCQSMSIGTYEEELAYTKTLKDEEMDYWAIVLYGKWSEVEEWTRKFSLFK